MSKRRFAKAAVFAVIFLAPLLALAGRDDFRGRFRSSMDLPAGIPGEVAGHAFPACLSTGDR